MFKLRKQYFLFLYEVHNQVFKTTSEKRGTRVVSSIRSLWRATNIDIRGDTLWVDGVQIVLGLIDS
ncbi:hypothetical protein CANARDRAFT_206319 [[Candida] arabinofermentans NRRL YB-2248]|uniref:Uncharacterized protein n=1 Tax=[Candida] arabinofermentans NRRL YB-2248 TaxID=983967 RepID=A0A1E4T503_9ASCO|nr:hypothetical protein CANARDRAFT_206319 [[Candida] arabinofermentans NRRL YB-2248]